MTNFKTRIYSIVKAIPEGKTLSYGEVAELAGHPGASRAVGSALKKCADPSIPCHRVIKADGSLGGYNGKLGLKKELLAQEGAI